MRVNDVLINSALNFRVAASDPGLIKPAVAANNPRIDNSQEVRNLDRQNFESVFDSIAQTTSSINVSRAIQVPFSADGTRQTSTAPLTTEVFPQLLSGAQALNSNSLLNALSSAPELSIFQNQSTTLATNNSVLTDKELEAQELDLQGRLFSLLLLEETTLLSGMSAPDTGASDFFSLFNTVTLPGSGIGEEFQTQFPFEFQLTNLSPFNSGIRLFDIQQEIQNVIDQLIEIDKQRRQGTVESQQTQETNSNEAAVGSALDMVV